MAAGHGRPPGSWSKGRGTSATCQAAARWSRVGGAADAGALIPPGCARSIVEATHPGSLLNEVTREVGLQGRVAGMAIPASLRDAGRRFAFQAVDDRPWIGPRCLRRPGG